MTNDKTALIKKVTEYKALDAILKIAVVPSLIAAVVGLAGWMWNTSLQLADIRRSISEEDSQWELIKENTDDFWTVRSRLVILEYVTGIDGHVEQENRKPLDVDDMIRKVDEEMENRKNEGVDNWKMMQQQSK